ncbi:hypothetical protein [Lysinibacillus xylanilyticus]|uniref:hypothetical protein n=1 Tax=Lysinibacillus xylanilyticus TaxID=582475 RepID=UPI003AF2165F
MDKKTEQKKVFLDIVQQLRQLIKMEKIQAGEKYLPNESFQNVWVSGILCERGIAKFRVVRSY